MKVLITGAHGDIAQSIFRIIKTAYSKKLNWVDLLNSSISVKGLAGAVKHF